MPFDLPSYVMGSENGSGGGDIVLKNLTVTENGVTTAPQGQAFKKVTVNVPQPVYQQKTVTSNGEVTADEGYDALSKVTVAVPLPSGSINITENGTVDISAYQTAVVNVPKGIPIEVSTAAGMTAVLIAANVGKAYKFIGTTDATYTNGDIYVVEESA